MRSRLQPIFIYVCIVLSSGPIAAQSPPTPSSQKTDFQSWNELDVFTRLRPNLDVTWIARMRFSEELPNPAVYLLGTDWNFRVAKHLLITPSYYYFVSHTASGVLVHGQAPILAFTPVLSHGRLKVADRNRFGGRFGINGIGPSWVYRNRARIDYQIGPLEWETSLFAWDEIFYFSNPGDWKRNRIAAGGRKEFSKRFAADLYYQRENDKHTNLAHINTIAFVLELRLRESR